LIHWSCAPRKKKAAMTSSCCGHGWILIVSWRAMHASFNAPSVASGDSTAT
jgi:hypothetical protein